jgi:hypothetical protein
MALHTHRMVDAAWLGESRAQVVSTLPFPPSLVWAALRSHDIWRQWLKFDQLVWTSPEPLGPGCTRTVKMGRLHAEEVFFTWEEGRAMAFAVPRSTLPVRALAEGYRLTEVPGGCEVRWTGRVDAAFPIGWIFTQILARGMRSSLPKLEQVIRANLAALED